MVIAYHVPERIISWDVIRTEYGQELCQNYFSTIGVEVLSVGKPGIIICKGSHVVAPLPLVPLGTRCLDFRTTENAGQDLLRAVITHDMVIHISALDKTTPHVTLMITMSVLAKAMLILCTCYLQTESKKKLKHGNATLSNWNASL